VCTRPSRTSRPDFRAPLLSLVPVYSCTALAYLCVRWRRRWSQRKGGERAKHTGHSPVLVNARLAVGHRLDAGGGVGLDETEVLEVSRHGAGEQGRKHCT
jgi:hypothetical protein